MVTNPTLLYTILISNYSLNQSPSTSLHLGIWRKARLSRVVPVTRKTLFSKEVGPPLPELLKDLLQVGGILEIKFCLVLGNENCRSWEDKLMFSEWFDRAYSPQSSSFRRSQLLVTHPHTSFFVFSHTVLILSKSGKEEILI